MAGAPHTMHTADSFVTSSEMASAPESAQMDRP